MAIIANILIGIGFTSYAFTCLWLLIIASEKHILWVPACIFIPLASLIFCLIELGRNPKSISFKSGGICFSMHRVWFNAQLIVAQV